MERLGPPLWQGGMRTSGFEPFVRARGAVGAAPCANPAQDAISAVLNQEPREQGQRTAAAAQGAQHGPFPDILTRATTRGGSGASGATATVPGAACAPDNRSGSEDGPGAAAPAGRAPSRIVLTPADAVMIYKAKHQKHADRGTAARCSAQYGITSKAVRDVWNHRTWTMETSPYWTPAERLKHAPLQKKKREAAEGLDCR